MRRAFLLLITLAALGIGGCAGFSKDGGFDAVADAARRRLASDIEWPRTSQERAKADAQVAALLGHPLSAEDAVQIALLNNRMLQGAFEELGISEADLVQAGRLPNPRFDLRHASAAGQYDIEETLSFNVLSLLTMPYARDIERQRFAQDAESRGPTRRAARQGHSRSLLRGGRRARIARLSSSRSARRPKPARRWRKEWWRRATGTAWTRPASRISISMPLKASPTRSWPKRPRAKD